MSDDARGVPDAAVLRWRTEEVDDPQLLEALPALYAEAFAALRVHPAVPDDLRARLRG